MTVQIDWGRTYITEDSGVLYLTHSETGDDYAAWQFFADQRKVNEYNSKWSSESWKWENQGCDLRDLTLSPSLKYEGGIGPNFHIFVRGGEIEHCGDCQCGCE